MLSRQQRSVYNSSNADFRLTPRLDFTLQVSFTVSVAYTEIRRQGSLLATLTQPLTQPVSLFPSSDLRR
jgi:hypothetical protein